MHPPCRHCEATELSCLTWLASNGMTARSCANCHGVKRHCPNLPGRKKKQAANTEAIGDVKINAKGADCKKKKLAGTQSIGECHGVFTEFLIIFKVKTNAVVANNDDPDWVNKTEVIAAKVQDQPQGMSTTPTDIGISQQLQQLTECIGELLTDVQDWRAGLQSDVLTLRAADEELCQSLGSLHTQHQENCVVVDTRISQAEKRIMTLMQIVKNLEAQGDSSLSAFQPPIVLPPFPPSETGLGASYSREAWEWFDMTAAATQPQSISGCLGNRHLGSTLDS